MQTGFPVRLQTGNVFAIDFFIPLIATILMLSYDFLQHNCSCGSRWSCQQQNANNDLNSILSHWKILGRPKSLARLSHFLLDWMAIPTLQNGKDIAVSILAD